jgi:hypothetical protein
VAKTVKEQLEALPIVDTLKREEASLAGEWEPVAAANSGKCTLTGWTITAEKTSAAAKRKATTNFVTGGIMVLEIPVLHASGQFIEEQFGVTGEAQKAGLAIKATGPATCELSLFHKGGALGSQAGVALAAGDIFGLSWEPSSGKLTAWKKTGGTWAEIFSKTAEAPTSPLKPAIFFSPEAVAGVAGRAANVGWAPLEGKAPPFAPRTARNSLLRR